MAEDPRPAPIPCRSCPYRLDVPSGIWDATEYTKLPRYDGETWEQPLALFMCHQSDGRLCAGWLACHDADELLALRLHKVDRSAYGYKSPVPVFASGAAACAHGLKDIDKPSRNAQRMMAKIERSRRGTPPKRRAST